VKRIGLLAALAALLLAPTAQAAEAGGQAWAEAQIAREFWADRGVYGCETLTLEIIELPPLALGQSDPGGCSISIDAGVADSARDGWKGRRYAVAMECATMVHEFAHTVGWLPADPEPGDPYHAQSGLMAAFVTDDNIPADCRAFASRVVPSKRARTSRKVTRRPVKMGAQIGADVRSLNTPRL
jgi:hypothetical protein